MAPRIHAVLPNAKLLAVLRDPVDRAISHYFHDCKKGREKLPIEEAMAAALEVLDFEAVRAQRARDGAPRIRLRTYKALGLYAQQVERYLEFFPRERVLLLQSEAFFTRPREVIAEAHRFLGVDPDQCAADFTPRNQGDYDPARVPDAVYEHLARFFEPHNEQLYRLVGADWGWRRPRTSAPTGGSA